ISYSYTGSEIRPNVSVTLAGGSLPSDKNWTASWSSNVNVGTARVTLTGTGYCAGTVSTTFQITAANLSGASIASIADQTYTGSALAPTPTVTYGGRTLAAGADYTVSYSSNVNVGTATVTVTGNGNYTGTKSATFRIVAASSGDIAVSPIADQTYTGSAITPALTVTSGGRTLVPGTDYTASYSSNVNVGTATVAVTGMGNYSGSKSATFRIVAANIGGASVAQIPDQTYTGSAIAPEPTVTLGGRTLVSGNDYTVSYASNTDVGTATVTVTGNGNYTGTKSATFRIVAPTVATYTVSYDANGGVGTPSSQVKQEGMPLTLSSAQPAKAYTLSYNSCGGSVSPASKNVSCIFKGWNTDRSGSGTPYSSGGSYTADADATLYAQWENPVVGELAVPARSGYEFTGWFTSATGGTRVDALTVAVGNMTLFAQWADPYNLGDETYSFENYGDSDSPGGHCFGMSMTSAGYNNGLLDIARIGGNSNTPLYSFERTETVKQPICYYQKKQDHYRDDSTVAGGSYYLNFNKNMRENDKYDIASDWQSVVNYVKGHDYDNTGLLQIGFRKKGEGGHAINFLRYENVNGQDRIYAYDNNFPNQETYFYRNASGAVLEAPVQTFSGAIDCIALRDIRIYFDRVKGFDSSRVLYMAENAAIVQGFTYTYLEGSQSDSEYVMYEIPADKDKVTIIPKKSNADFIYMDTEYSFGEVTDGTRGELEFASSSEGVAGSGATFTIYEADSAIPNVTLSKTVYTYDGSVCKPSVAVEVDGASLRESRDYDVEYPAGMVDAGQYDVKVTLKGEYSGTIYKTFNIVKADQELTATAPASVAVGETARVVSDGKGAIAYSSNDESIATVTDEGVVEGIAPGKAVITVEAAGDDNYEAATTTVAIDVVDSAVKGANPMVAKGKTVKVKASSIKKKSAVIKTAKAFSVSKAQGKVTYKKVTGSKKVTVASNGKVTVKKGLKKGKHKIQVKVTAKGNAKWDAKSTLVTLTIKVV
ncbi:MAG: InlB B-repeat-containing protein, partial [Eggerthellaceae bacterium]|nr:InlB B-repeat-containing protein [Eggerthellaceae bacterium]